MKKNGAAKPGKDKGSMGRAILLAVVTTFIVGLALSALLYVKPPSDLKNYYDVVTHPDSGISPNGPLMQKFRASVSHADIYVTCVSLLLGGLALGRISPKGAGRRRIVRTALTLGLILAIVNQVWNWGSIWAVTAYLHKSPPHADSLLIAVQTGMVIVWALGCTLGAFLGALWRDRASGKGRLEKPAIAPATQK